MLIKLVIVITIIKLEHFEHLQMLKLVVIRLIIVTSQKPLSMKEPIITVRVVLVMFEVMQVVLLLLQLLKLIFLLVFHNLPSCYHIDLHLLVQILIVRESHQLVCCHK